MTVALNIGLIFLYNGRKTKGKEKETMTKNLPQ